MTEMENMDKLYLSLAGAYKQIKSVMFNIETISAFEPSGLPEKIKLLTEFVDSSSIGSLKTLEVSTGDLDIQGGGRDIKSSEKNVEKNENLEEVVRQTVEEW